eukprot:TRINITY_DN4419_c1_g5_i2.p1 TRINITY_DN4419_c1_g5~~TRINITY_DN4419_c1_g5_i2.p1  ORF type:complete len:1145 (+),score=494.62 TRINITY_DN4419_c1_g5_i2:447-3437(+)
MPAVESALRGYHACIFAYGQTGSGKTHTMLGNDGDPGISPRVIEYLFEQLDEMKGKTKKGGFEYSVEISFMEIYNEAVKDLFVSKASDEGGQGRRKSRSASISALAPPSPNHKPSKPSPSSTPSATPPPANSLTPGLPASRSGSGSGSFLSVAVMPGSGQSQSATTPTHTSFGSSSMPLLSDLTVELPAANLKKPRRSVNIIDDGPNSPTAGGGRPRQGARLSGFVESTFGEGSPPKRTQSMQGRRRRSSVAVVGGDGRKKSTASAAGADDDQETEKLGYKSLKVRHSPSVGIFVEGLQRLGAEQGINTADDVKRAMTFGMQHRATAATQMNDQSSRSHAIFQICVKAANKVKGVQRYSHINLVDLAGSERVKMSGAEGGRFTEATKINLSLSTLRRVIDALIENATKKKGQMRVVAPYRDSILTWILSESLGGNSKTLMIATVSPAESNREDSINTLRYAFKAKSIVNTVRVNEQKTSVVLSAMMGEIATMRQRLVDDEADEESNANLKAEIDNLSNEYLKMQSESGATLQEIESTKAKLQTKQEEAAAKDEEVAKLQDEKIEEKHLEERELHNEQAQAVAESKREVDELKLQKDMIAAIQEQERLEKEALAEQKAEVEYREELYRQEMLENKRKQFALAFNKAFKNTHNTTKRELMAREIALINERAVIRTNEHQNVLLSIRDLGVMNEELGHRILEMKTRVAKTENQKIQSEHHSTQHIRVLQAEKKVSDDALNLVKSEHSRVANNAFIATERRAKEAHLAQERHRHAAARLASAKDEQYKKQSLRAQLGQQAAVLSEEIERLSGKIDEAAALNAGNEDKRTTLLAECAALRDSNTVLSTQLRDTIEKQSDAAVDVSRLNVQELAHRAQLDEVGLNHDDLRHFVSHRFFPSSSPFAGLTSAYGHTATAPPVTQRPRYETQLGTFQRSATHTKRSPSKGADAAFSRQSTQGGTATPRPRAAAATPRGASSSSYTRSGTYTPRTYSNGASPRRAA